MLHIHIHIHVHVHVHSYVYAAQWSLKESFKTPAEVKS